MDAFSKATSIAKKQKAQKSDDVLSLSDDSDAGSLNSSNVFSIPVSKQGEVIYAPLPGHELS